MTKIGDEKTIYSYAEGKLQEHSVACIGFMSDEDNTPVWHCNMLKRGTFELLELYVAFDGLGMSQGYLETPEEVFAIMFAMADFRKVQCEHLIANVKEAQKDWVEKEAKKKPTSQDSTDR